MASQASEAPWDRSRQDAGRDRVDRAVLDTPSISQTHQEQLVSLRAEAERYRVQAEARAAELSELRALLGEAELRREEGLSLLCRLRGQERLIAELRPHAASNKLALQALRQLQKQGKAQAPPNGASVGAPGSSLWSRSIGRLMRRQGDAGRI